MKSKPKILVLMSTYNGEKYLVEQINSILSQKNVDVDLFIRDDNSTDSTMKILSRYSEKYNNISYYHSKKLGSAKSFMDLIYRCSDKYKYYAFSDQDDYWCEDKIISAINKIKKYDNEPSMYFSSKKIGDRDLNVILENDFKNQQNTFESSCIRNIATGCTILINNNLMNKLKKYKVNKIEMHDAWIYKLCNAIGGICVYDNEPHIIYRQHGNNVIGYKESFAKKILRRFSSFKKCKHYRRDMSAEILAGYYDYVPNNNKKILEMLSTYEKDYKSKIKLLINPKMKTEKISETLIFKMALLFNKV